MSPSAVIFGPMVAIFTEAFLLEISTLVFGKTIFGFLFGSGLAMTWVLFQKIANYIIFYGYNIVEIYESLMQHAQKQLQWQLNVVWTPIIFLLFIYILFGIIAGMIGIKTGRRLENQLSIKLGAKINYNPADSFQKPKIEFNHSIGWLILNILLLVGSLILISYAPIYYWVTAIPIIAGIWAIRYKRALRQLLRPKFWIFFAAITMIAAFVITQIQSTNNSVLDGFLIGIEMNFRALTLILGFTVLGTELYNPRIKQFLVKSHFKQLSLALELSFDSLPSMIAGMPDFKTIAQNPVSVMYHVISQAEQRLEQIRTNFAFRPQIFIITGQIGQGKTKLVQKLVTDLKIMILVELCRPEL